MAVITTIKPFSQVGKFLVAPTVLTGADTLNVSPAARQTLYIQNTTGSTVTIIVDGAAGTTVVLPGMGAITDVTGGYSIPVAAGTIQAVALVNIRNFTQGVVNVTGGAAGVTAWMQEG